MISKIEARQKDTKCRSRLRKRRKRDNSHCTQYIRYDRSIDSNLLNIFVYIYTKTMKICSSSSSYIFVTSAIGKEKLLLATHYQSSFTFRNNSMQKSIFS